MLYTKTNPVGIDKELQRIQTRLHDSLLAKWVDVDQSKYDCYGRTYRNQDANGRYIPENFKGGKDYAYDPLYNDRVYATSFFGANANWSAQGRQFNAGCHLIFSCNLVKLKPSITHRADEEVHVDVLDSLRDSLAKDTITELVLWQDNIFREYSGFKAQDGSNFTDMHPKHVFRINFDLTFLNNNC